MLNLFFVRHGESGFDALTDRARVLTQKGHDDTLALFDQFIVQRALSFDAVFCSPYQRTQQSCRNILDAAGFSSQCVTHLSDHLMPNSTPESVSELLYQYAKGLDFTDSAYNILVVTHMPIIAYSLAFLVEGELQAARNYPMQPGSCAHLQCELPLRGLSTLRSIYHP